MARESTIYQMLVEDLSAAKASRFLTGLAKRSDVIYKESDAASFGDPDIHPDYAPHLNGHVRFARHQSMFLKLAADCNLESRIVYCEQNGFPSAVVKIGRFHFTDHHVNNSHEVTCLNPSLMRFQHSAVNLSLVQRSLFELPFDENKLAEATYVYGNFLHGCRGTGKTFSTDGFVHIAFPCAVDVTNTEEARAKLRYIERYDLSGVLESVVARENAKRSIAKPTIRVVVPKIKQQQ